VVPPLHARLPPVDRHRDRRDRGGSRRRRRPLGIHQSRNRGRREITVSLENVASIVDSQLQADVRQMRTTLERLAVTLAPVVQRATSNDLQQRLKSVQAYTRHYLQLRVLDMHGDVRAASDDTLPEPVNRVAVAYALDGSPYVSEPFRSTAYKSEVVALAVPIRNASGGIIGAVTFVFDIQAMLQDLIAHSRFNQSGYAIVVDGAGDVIAHPDASQVASSRVQALNKEFGTTILITDDTLAAVDGQFVFREMPATPLRGKQRAIKFYEVLAAREAAAIITGERPRIEPVA
jgi:hypothetical protein